MIWDLGNAGSQFGKDYVSNIVHLPKRHKWQMIVIKRWVRKERDFLSRAMIWRKAVTNSSMQANGGPHE